MDRLTIDELLARSRDELDRLTPQRAWAAMADGARLIDIRSDLQVLDGGPALGDHLILLCQQGYQSSLAAVTLRRMGFDRATDVIGGFEAWRAGGVPTRRPG